MITIEEKMKLFTKIVYDKIEKYNQNAVASFNSEYGNLIEEKKNEFEKEAERIYALGIKNIQKEKLQILSKARVEEKKIILNQRKKIFEEMLSAMKEYAEGFTKTNEYKNMFLSDLAAVLEDINNSKELEIFITDTDSRNFSADIKEVFKNYNITLKHDNELIGGFIIIDKVNNVRIDMSILNRIDDSKEIIGEKLFAILQ